MRAEVRDGLFDNADRLFNLLSLMRSRPSTGGLWTKLLRLCAAGLLLFYVHYLPWHIAQEHHLPDDVTLTTDGDSKGGHELADSSHAEESPDGHHHDHVPHPVAEHEVQMFSKSGDSLVLDYLLAPASEVLVIALQVSVSALPVEIFLRPPSPVSPAAHPRGPPAA